MVKKKKYREYYMTKEELLEKKVAMKKATLEKYLTAMRQDPDFYIYIISSSQKLTLIQPDAFLDFLRSLEEEPWDNMV